MEVNARRIRFSQLFGQKCSMSLVIALWAIATVLLMPPEQLQAQIVDNIQPREFQQPLTPLSDRRFSYFIRDPDREPQREPFSPAQASDPSEPFDENSGSTPIVRESAASAVANFPNEQPIVSPVESVVPGSHYQPLVLSDFIEHALQNHPTLAAAAARIEAVGAEAVQSSLANNPIVGVFGEEIFNDENALLGAYWSRTHINPAKLALRGNAQLSQTEVLRQKLQVQRFRILTDTRSAFYRVLIGQKQTELAQSLVDLQTRAVENAEVLFRAEETSKTELLQTQIQARQTEFKLQQSQANLAGAWRELTAIIGAPELPLTAVEGNVDVIGSPLDWDTILGELLTSSPEIAAAQADVVRARTVIARELGENIGDINTQFRVGHDTSTDDFFGGFQVGVPLRTANSNQGNIAAAKARYHAAVLEVRRVELNVQKRLAVVFRDYETSVHQTKVYTDQLLPKARETLQLVSQAYREGEVSFLQLLSSQQTLANVTTDYLNSLGQLWNTRQRIEGLLLSDSLEK